MAGNKSTTMATESGHLNNLLSIETLEWIPSEFYRSASMQTISPEMSFSPYCREICFFFLFWFVFVVFYFSTLAKMNYTTKYAAIRVFFSARTYATNANVKRMREKKQRERQIYRWREWEWWGALEKNRRGQWRRRKKKWKRKISSYPKYMSVWF